MTLSKICGLRDEPTLKAAIRARADLIGFVFYPRSPRAIENSRAASLAGLVPADTRIVGLFVDPDDFAIDTALREIRLDMIQLHGKETPERVRTIRERFGTPVMKALGVTGKADLQKAEAYTDSCDWLLFDARPAAGGLPGGTGKSFDWNLMEGYKPPMPWMLAGGLTPENVADALSLLKPHAVDVSSGVESSPGIKDEHKIRAFIKAVHDHDQR